MAHDIHTGQDQKPECRSTLDQLAAARRLSATTGRSPPRMARPPRCLLHPIGTTFAKPPRMAPWCGTWSLLRRLRRAEAAAARPAAAKKPKTRRRSPNPNAGPNQRSSSQATRSASPALQKPLSIEVIRLLSPRRLAVAVPSTTPTTSAKYARRPETMRKPAGQCLMRAKTQPRRRAARATRAQPGRSGNTK